MDNWVIIIILYLTSVKMQLKYKANYKNHVYNWVKKKIEISVDIFGTLFQ